MKGNERESSRRAIPGRHAQERFPSLFGVTSESFSAVVLTAGRRSYRDLVSLMRRHADELVALGLALLMSAEVLASDTLNTGAAAGAALLAGGALALRRVLPLLGFLASSAGLLGLQIVAAELDGNTVGFIVIYLLAHYSLGRWTVGSEAWLGAFLILGSMVVFAVGDASENDRAISEIDLGGIAFTIGFVGGPWAAGLAIRLRKAREAALDSENRRLRLEQEASARRAVVEERARIARELHDVVSHAISVTVLQARGARATLGRDEDAVRRALDAIEQTNTAALSDMRRLLAVLRDTDRETEDDAARDPHAPLPSLAHLDRLVAQVGESGVPVELHFVGDVRSVPPGVDLSAYRIVQEALTNVLKHAGPATAQVTLTYDTDALGVRVFDDGTGGPMDGTGHGMIGIRERVALVGGEVVAGSRPEGGFELVARLPYSVEAAS